MSQIRYHISPIYTVHGFVARVMTRREHEDQQLAWYETWQTEPYHKERDAVKRAKLWVRKNLPDAVR
jgi:hypothetical protein